MLQLRIIVFLFCCKYLTVTRLKMLMFCLGNKIVTITQIQYLVSVLYGKGMKNNLSGERFNVLNGVSLASLWSDFNL